MKSFPTDIRFKFPWRPYQERVLEELSAHLADDRLHVIAPPGSGKTVLGLEVIRRLDRPALVLAPTLAIRDQWVDRFVDLFLSGSRGRPDWISTDLYRPGFMTVGTYQGLHQLASARSKTSGRGNPGASAGRSFNRLRRVGMGTVVVDEAHHLRTAWWKSLTDLLSLLDGPTVVALTATPPYDVSHAEWKRYKALCGPVDSEITVPELLLEKNLCPHQDYVRFSLPDPATRSAIQEFRGAVDRLREEILFDFDLIDAVEAHPWMIHPEEHLDEIFSETEAFLGMLVFLHHLGRRIFPETLAALELSREQIPMLDRGWLEVLLTHVLFRDAERFSGCDHRIRAIRRRLGRMGAVDRQRVALGGSKKIRDALTANVGKMESIREIARAESESLGSELRMVILTDFIHADDMPTFVDDLRPLNRIGVVPVFERIRREFLWGVRPGILCGSLVVIPESAVADLRIIAVEAGAGLEGLRFEPLGHDPGYQVVHAAGTAREKMVPMMTALFSLGEVNLLVGTKSLLGEGWDAPFINALILATWVGSWVSSNQMRGRALRTVAGDPEKTADIWHLACVEPGLGIKGDDLELLDRRFKAFVGVSLDGDRIENGTDRLGIPPPPFGEKTVRSLNDEMIRRSADREGLRRAWASALNRGRIGVQLVEEVAARAPAVPGPLVLRRAAGRSLKQFAWALSTALVLLPWSQGLGSPMVWGAAAVVLGGGFCGTLPRTLRALGFLARYGPDADSLRRIGRVVTASLAHIGRFRTPPEALRVEVKRRRDGAITCGLHGGTTLERSLFLESLQEVIDPVENPRYLIRLKKTGRDRRGKRYFPVPGLLGRNKESAAFFHRMWQKHLGPAELIYTRTPAGRKALLKARLRSLSGLLDGKSERSRFWR